MIYPLTEDSYPLCCFTTLLEHTMCYYFVLPLYLPTVCVYELYIWKVLYCMSVLLELIFQISTGLIWSVRAITLSKGGGQKTKWGLGQVKSAGKLEKINCTLLLCNSQPDFCCLVAKRMNLLRERFAIRFTKAHTTSALPNWKVQFHSLLLTCRSALLTCITRCWTSFSGLR